MAILDRKLLRDDSLMDKKVRAGLPVDSFFELRDLLQTAPEHLAELIKNRSYKTLRRQWKEGKPLASAETEGVIRFARLYFHAVDVLGSSDGANKWLRTKNRVLGSVTPLQMAETEPGARTVDQLLGRIEHGIFS